MQAISLVSKFFLVLFFISVSPFFDKFYIKVLNKEFEYTIDDIRIVEPEEYDCLNIVEGKEYVTLITCTPTGINTHRLLVRGYRSN